MQVPAGENMEKVSTLSKSVYRNLLFYIIALSVLVLDQVSKFIIRDTLYLGQAIPEEGIFRITYNTNTGAVFGLFQGQNTTLLFFAIIALAVILLYFRYLPANNRLLQVAIGFILGGSLGNLAERIYQGSVTDFLDVRLWGDFHWPTFNVADSAISVGVIILMAFFIFNIKELQ